MSVTEVIVFAEGQSDELFLKRVVAPALRELQVYLKPQTMHTSRDSAGGAINFDRLKINVRNTLRQSSKSYLTTFFDLYALDSDMPGRAEAAKLKQPADKAHCIQAALNQALVADNGCRPDRLFVHVQPYELEGLFFSSPLALSETVPGWDAYAPALESIRAAFDTPEHINDSFENKPSARLERLLNPNYRKTRHAPLIGERIGLAALVAQCPHFAQWVQRLQALKPL